MAHTIDYATPSRSPAAPEPNNALQRYFVYAVDMQTIRSVRFEAQAYGLPNLMAALRVKGYSPDMVVISPDPAVTEPTELGAYLDQNTDSPDDATRGRLEKLVAGAGEAGYKLAPAVAPGSPKKRLAAKPDLLLRTADGFTSPRPELLRLPGHARSRLAGIGFVCGLLNAGIGLLLISIFVLAPARTGELYLLAAAAFVIYFAPGVTMLVMGLDKLKYERWVPIVATAVGGLLVGLMLLSVVADALILPTANPVRIGATLAVLAIESAYLLAAIAALREK